MAEKPNKERGRYVADVMKGIAHDLEKEKDECGIGEIDSPRYFQHPGHLLLPVQGVRLNECQHCNPDRISWLKEYLQGVD